MSDPESEVRSGTRWRRVGINPRYDDLLTLVTVRLTERDDVPHVVCRYEGAHPSETDRVLPLATLLERYEMDGTGSAPLPKQRTLFD